MENTYYGPKLMNDKNEDAIELEETSNGDENISPKPRIIFSSKKIINFTFCVLGKRASVFVRTTIRMGHNS